MRKMNKLRLSLSLVTAVAGLSTASPVLAAYTITFQQVGSDVVSTGTGSLNLASLTLILSSVANNYLGFEWPNNPSAIVGTGSYSVYYFNSVSGPSNFGTGGNAAGSLPSSGGLFGITPGGSDLFVPQSYVNGSDSGISTSTYSNTTLASLGITPGAYVYSFGSGETSDTFTIQAGGGVGPVPEPATWAMMLVGFAGVGVTVRRRRKVTGPQTA